MKKFFIIFVGKTGQKVRFTKRKQKSNSFIYFQINGFHLN